MEAKHIAHLKHAHAEAPAQTIAQLEKPTLRQEGCEKFRVQVEQVFGKALASTALFVASKESGNCKHGVSLKPNSNGTYDYCIFQINDEPETRHNLDLCIKRAYDKYVQGRIGTHNWSAWYAVCTPGSNPVPKYKNIKCK